LRRDTEKGVSVGLVVSTVISVSLLVMLCIGFTFNYMMEKFPNFAHTSYASLGTMITYYLVRFYGFNPYFTWPISALIGGLLGVSLYITLVRPIKKRAFSEITLTFTFYIISQIISQGLAMFSYWLIVGNGIQSQSFNLYRYDYRINGIHAIGIIAPITVFTVVVVLQVFLKWSKYGIAMRATAEDEDLAQGLGVNIRFVHLFSWFISGSLAALAGSIISMWLSTSINFSDTLLINVMAGSVLGGLGSITGAIIGGLLIAVGAKAITWFLITNVGVNMGVYEGLIPILFLFLVLTIEPNGLTAFNYRNISISGLNDAWIRFKRTMRNVMTSE
jgi:branched-chain amino acid transport system permease protein